MRALPAEALALGSAHSEAGSVTVANFLHSLGVPDQNHIRQLAKMLKGPIEGRSGTCRCSTRGSERFETLACALRMEAGSPAPLRRPCPRGATLKHKLRAFRLE